MKWSIILTTVMLCSAGCAIHYENCRSGREQLWGLGQLKLEKQKVGRDNDCAVVTTLVRVPGLCLEVRRDHFGITFGYLNREQLIVAKEQAAQNIQSPHHSLGIPLFADTNSS